MNNDLMNDLDRENRETVDGYLEKIRTEAYRYYESVRIIEVNGCCPYGHKSGDLFKVTT